MQTGGKYHVRLPTHREVARRQIKKASPIGARFRATDTGERLSVDREGWNARYADRAYVWNVEPSRLLKNEARTLPPHGRVLDLGCGEGRNTVWLASRGWRATGVDFSEEGLDKAHALARRHGVQVRWLRRDLTEYRPRPRHYDLVLMCYLHLPRDDLAVVMAHAAAAVKGGGMFLYIGHDLSNLTHGHGGPRDPAVLSTPPDIAAMLPGFGILRAGVVKRAVNSEPGHGGKPGALALDGIVRAVRPGHC